MLALPPPAARAFPAVAGSLLVVRVAAAATRTVVIASTATAAPATRVGCGSRLLARHRRRLVGPREDPSRSGACRNRVTRSRLCEWEDVAGRSAGLARARWYARAPPPPRRASAAAARATPSARRAKRTSRRRRALPKVRSDDRLRTHTMVGQGGRTGGVRVSVPADSLISRETKPTSPPAVKSSLLDASHRSPTHTREPSAPPLPQRRAFTPLAGAVRSPARRLVLAVEGRVAHARRHPLPIHQGLPQHAAAPLATSLVKMAAVAIAATVVQPFSVRRLSSVVCCRTSHTRAPRDPRRSARA